MEPVNLNFVPSLRDQALLRAAINLSISKPIYNNLPPPDSEIAFEVWFSEKRSLVLERIGKLFLPKAFEVELYAIAKEIMKRIDQWRRLNLHSHVFYDFIRKHFHLVKWTVNGEIDDEKTAEYLANLEFLEPDSRYYVACYYCLEDTVYKLRPQVDRLRFNKYKNTEMTCDEICLHFQNMRMEFTDADTWYCMFISAYENENIAAMKYIFPKLSERNEVRAFYHILTSTFICKLKDSFEFSKFFFKNMPNILETLLFKEDCSLFLRYFLRWPQLNYFFDMLDMIYPSYIPHAHFYSLLVDISLKGSDSDNLVFLIKRDSIFQAVWNRGSKSCKRYVIMITMHRPNVLLALLKRNNDLKGLKLILSFATARQQTVIQENLDMMMWRGVLRPSWKNMIDKTKKEAKF